jgi:hypothetical protein
MKIKPRPPRSEEAARQAKVAGSNYSSQPNEYPGTAPASNGFFQLSSSVNDGGAGKVGKARCAVQTPRRGVPTNQNRGFTPKVLEPEKLAHKMLSVSNGKVTLLKMSRFQDKLSADPRDAGHGKAGPPGLARGALTFENCLRRPSLSFAKKRNNTIHVRPF